MQSNFKQIFLSLLLENNINLSPDSDKIAKFCQLYEILSDTNQKFNLTAINTPEGVSVRHFCDCIKLERFIPQNSNVLDVGCGGGFPSLPLAIIRKDLKITSLDSTAKKIEYVRNTASALRLDNITTVCARAEEYAAIGREKYDTCVSRAVARMNILSELCIPFVKVGGLFIAMKSVSADEELSQSSLAIEKLGGFVSSTNRFDLYEQSEIYTREICVIKKESCTPLKYPRRFSEIKRNPL